MRTKPSTLQGSRLESMPDSVLTPQNPEPRYSSEHAPDTRTRESLDQEVVRICRDLIRIDTTNLGSYPDAANERPAAEYVMELLQEVGLEPTMYESAPGRASVVARIEGREPDLPALVVHGHLDVVPAQAEDWSVNPFEAAIKDDMIWGRGAVDMKNMNAMILTTVRDMARRGLKPRRDLIVAFFADEEAGGEYGALWMVKNHPEVFAGATEAISEVGGYSTTINGERVYLVQTAEKGRAWGALTAHGRAGHGSAVTHENPIVHLAAAIARIAGDDWPCEYNEATTALLEGIAHITGTEFDPDNPQPQLEALGPTVKFIANTLQTTSNPTVLKAGYKDNVIPQEAQARLDVRTLPGKHESTLERIAELAGEHVTYSIDHHRPSVSAPIDAPIFDAMRQALNRHDPGCHVLPYMLGAGTDNNALADLGINGYGFAPLLLPAELDFTGMFHGIDERVPIESITFGRAVLSEFLLDY